MLDYRLMQSDERYPVNLGNPSEMTIPEFAERIRGMTGSRSKDHVSAAARGRSEAAPGYYEGADAARIGAKSRAEDGLRDTVEYFQGLPAAVA